MHLLKNSFFAVFKFSQKLLILLNQTVNLLLDLLPRLLLLLVMLVLLWKHFWRDQRGLVQGWQWFSFLELPQKIEVRFLGFWRWVGWMSYVRTIRQSWVCGPLLIWVHKHLLNEQGDIVLGLPTALFLDGIFLGLAKFTQLLLRWIWVQHHLRCFLFFFESLDVFLAMGSDLHACACANMLFNLFPILSIHWVSFFKKSLLLLWPTASWILARYVLGSTIFLSPQIVHYDCWMI